jgi:hypothetical protein
MTAAELVYNGLALMLCAGLGLFAVLHLLRHVAIAGYHDLLWADPLAPARSPLEQRHLRQPCAECSMIAELVVTRAVPLR